MSRRPGRRDAETERKKTPRSTGKRRTRRRLKVRSFKLVRQNYLSSERTRTLRNSTGSPQSRKPRKPVLSRRPGVGTRRRNAKKSRVDGKTSNAAFVRKFEVSNSFVNYLSSERTRTLRNSTGSPQSRKPRKPVLSRRPGVGTRRRNAKKSRVDGKTSNAAFVRKFEVSNSFVNYLSSERTRTLRNSTGSPWPRKPRKPVLFLRPGCSAL